MKEPKWLQNINEKPSTRSRSGKQESRIAKELKGTTTINSGATFGQNDVLTDYAEIEAKTTSKESFSLKVADLDKLHKKCSPVKIPIMVIDFEESKKSVAVISYSDLKYLIDKANGS